MKPIRKFPIVGDLVSVNEATIGIVTRHWITIAPGVHIPDAALYRWDVVSSDNKKWTLQSVAINRSSPYSLPKILSHGKHPYKRIL